MRAKVFDSSYGLILLGLILLLTVYRVLVITQSGLSLDYEEAYYFGWARTLELGYYSKPPMIAWLIGLTTRVCGDGELCVKRGTRQLGQLGRRLPALGQSGEHNR